MLIELSNDNSIFIKSFIIFLFGMKEGFTDCPHTEGEVNIYSNKLSLMLISECKLEL